LIQQGTPAAGEDWPLFTVVYADPPWAYENEAPATAASNKFPTLTLEQLLELWDGPELRMAERLTEHAALMLWATAPNLRVALEFLARVGFEYKTNLIWRKRHSVIGAYSQGCHELLLVGIRGNLTPIDRLSSVFEGEPWSRLHSAKPDVVYDMIEAMFPEVYKLELFARRYRKGWASWGNELGLHEKEGEDDSAAQSLPRTSCMARPLRTTVLDADHPAVLMPILPSTAT
jgi:N6-adenosine-specific RNA methylase IME4